MSRILTIAAFAAAVMLESGAAHAQLKGFGSDNRDNKTGRTEDGLKADAEVDKLYRAKAGQKTPDPRADPWGDVRTPSTPAAQPTAKSKQKQP
jgi:hypothetical protein